MNNQDEKLKESLSETATVTPPPFRPDEEQPTIPQQEPGASPTFDQRMADLGIDPYTAQRMGTLMEGIDPGRLSSELLTTLARGITHDNDVLNADAAGYLRGRNEKIEAMLHPQPDDDEEQVAVPVFPRYCRRSVWE